MRKYILIILFFLSIGNIFSPIIGLDENDEIIRTINPYLNNIENFYSYEKFKELSSKNTTYDFDGEVISLNEIESIYIAYLNNSSTEQENKFLEEIGVDLSNKNTFDNPEEFYISPIENTNLEEKNTELIEEEKSYFDISFILFYVSMFFNLLCLVLIIILFRKRV